MVKRRLRQLSDYPGGRGAGDVLARAAGEPRFESSPRSRSPPATAELAANPRARSAKLRAAERAAGVARQAQKGRQSGMGAGTRRRAGNALFCLVLLGLTLGALGHVAVQAKKVEVALQLAQEQAAHEELLAEQRHLQLDIGRLKEPRRLVRGGPDEAGHDAAAGGHPGVAAGRRTGAGSTRGPGPARHGRR